MWNRMTMWLFEKLIMNRLSTWTIYVLDWLMRKLGPNGYKTVVGLAVTLFTLIIAAFPETQLYLLPLVETLKPHAATVAEMGILYTIFVGLAHKPIKWLQDKIAEHEAPDTPEVIMNTGHLVVLIGGCLLFGALRPAAAQSVCELDNETLADCPLVYQLVSPRGSYEFWPGGLNKFLTHQEAEQNFEACKTFAFQQFDRAERARKLLCNLSTDFAEIRALWKPVSENTGRPVMLFPGGISTQNTFAKLEIFDAIFNPVANITYRETHAGANGGRTHYDVSETADDLNARLGASGFFTVRIVLAHGLTFATRSNFRFTLRAGDAICLSEFNAAERHE